MTAAHFDLQQTDAYAIWREKKLCSRPESLDDLLVEINNPYHLTDGERQKNFNGLRASQHGYLRHQQA